MRNHDERIVVAVRDAGLEEAVAELCAAAFAPVADIEHGVVVVRVEAMDYNTVKVTAGMLGSVTVAGTVDGRDYLIAPDVRPEHLADYVRGFVGAHGGPAFV